MLGAGVRVDPAYTPVTSGLVLSLDSSSFTSSPAAGDPWPDLVSGPSFTLPNGATYSSSNGGLLTFDNTLSQSAHGTSLGSALTTFTAETWVKFNSVLTVSGEATATITEGYGGNPINFTIGCGMGNNATLWQGGFFDFGGVGWVLAGNLVPVVDTWYDMAVTYDGATLNFYVNGTLNDNVAVSITPNFGNQEIHVGERWDGSFLQSSFLNGSIPIVKVYNRALSPAEILQNYNANKSRFGL